MPRFFLDASLIEGETVRFGGEDAHHISRSLRMAKGDVLVVCDGAETEYTCVLEDFLPDCVVARIVSSSRSKAEPSFEAHLYQALPKGDKLDQIIQKAVECGVHRVTPFVSEHCVVTVKKEAESRKQERRCRIAAEAAKQCGRGRVPAVMPSVAFEEAIEQAATADIPLFCYEGEGLPSLREALDKVIPSFTVHRPTVAIVIGSEGGFSSREAALARERGLIPVSLGNRILRTETASSFVLACLVYAFDL